MIERKALPICQLIRASAVAIFAIIFLVQATTVRAADEAGVRQAGKDYLAAAQRGDLKALADFWTADGTYTDESGRTTKAHDALSKSMAANRLPRPFGNVAHVAVRFITDDVAVEDADCETVAVNGGTPIEGHYTAFWVRQDGRWKLDNLKETRIASPSSATDEIASLAVFAGEWSGQLNGATIHISAKWDANKKFMRRDFSTTSGKSPLAGTQEIGWDPIAGRIKSWAFLDDGSYGEGLWSLQGTVWMEISSRVLPDGRIVKATQVYSFPDKNTLDWKLIRGSVDGKPAQAMEVVLKRS
jgi:uncharacterized protein (TIGR02246 family)